MARTRSRDYDAIQASILDRSSELFASHGYAASSIGDIADACGCSKSRLYHYFESKEAILTTMLTDHVDILIEGGKEVLEAQGDPVERFRKLIRFFMEIYAVSRSKHVVLLTCMQFLPEDVRKDVYAKQRKLVAFVRSILKEIRPPGADRFSTLHADTMLFFGMINWTYTWYHADGKVPPADLADRSLQLFLNGYLSSGHALETATALLSREKRTRIKVASR